eukprot:scaffold153_cov347-Pavlova_lutheri.AAC.14
MEGVKEPAGHDPATVLRSTRESMAPLQCRVSIFNRVGHRIGDLLGLDDGKATRRAVGRFLCGPQGRIPISSRIE